MRNERIKILCNVKKDGNGVVSKNVLRWHGNARRMN